MFKTNIIGEDGLDWAPQEMKIPLNFFIHYTALKKKEIWVDEIARPLSQVTLWEALQIRA